jgi:hypothetical protein
VYAVYGGFFIVLSLVWGWRFDGNVPPDRFDVFGAVIGLAGVWAYDVLAQVRCSIGATSSVAVGTRMEGDLMSEGLPDAMWATNAGRWWPPEDSSSVNLDSTIERTLTYHQRISTTCSGTRSLGYLDWATRQIPSALTPGRG